MRIFACILAIPLLASPAYGQDHPEGKHRQRSEQKSEAVKPKVDEKAYESTLKSLPDQSFDPWRNMREPTPKK